MKINKSIITKIVLNEKQKSDLKEILAEFRKRGARFSSNLILTCFGPHWPKTKVYFIHKDGSSSGFKISR